MSRSEIIEYLEPYWSSMLDLMRSSLHSEVELLNQVNANILDHSGKMLRPLVSLLMAKAIGEPNDDSVRLAATAEMLHNATLMHDDVADESTERRGRPTLVSLLGPTAAVLVGDYWLSKAVGLVYDSSCRMALEKRFEKTMSDLAEGEMLQLQKAGTADTDEEDYFKIIHDKTASLFEAACESAAVSVGAVPEFQDAAVRFGHCLGLAFQIKDDILDYAGTAELGKPLGIDIKEQKITLPLLGALKGSPREAEIRAMVRDIHEHPEYSDEVRSFVMDNGGIQYAAARLDEYIAKAEEAISVLPESKAREALVTVARFNVYRQV